MASEEQDWLEFATKLEMHVIFLDNSLQSGAVAGQS